jgi:PAS domain S-box-containing protein
MNLFGKIYSVALILFILVIALITFQFSASRLHEAEQLLIEKQMVSGDLVTSEIQRWKSEDKWPFKALKALADQKDFLFWWVVADDNTIFLADNVDFVGTDAGSYFVEVKDFLHPQDEGAIVLSREKKYGVYTQKFSVGNENWTFWQGFSLDAIHATQNEIISSAVVSAVLGLSVLGVILFLLMRSLLNPLKDLTAGVEKIGAGSLEHRITVGSLDEIGRVSQAFNNMAESLQLDIAKREKVEEELKFTQFAVESNADAAFWIDSTGRFAYVNQMATEKLGYSRDELLKMHVADIGPDFPAEVWPQHWQDLLEHKSLQFEAIHQKKDGSIFPVDITANYIEFNGTAYNCAFVRDISERKEFEIALAAEKEQLAVTLRSIGDGVITTDINGRIVLLNKVAEQLTGWLSEEAEGKLLEDVFHIINERTRELCENPVTKVLSSGQIVELENHTGLIAKDGTEHSIADSGAPILNSASEIIGVVLVFRDVTDHLKTEQELLKVKKLESVGVLAGGIAHDFNNILAAILGNINLAKRDQTLSDKNQKLLENAEKASLRATKLTQQLLTFAKGGHPVIETASLAAVIKDSAEFFLHGNKIACEFDIPDDLWLVDIDKGQISQVVQNIVINASHAMPTGGTVGIKCENVKSRIRDKLSTDTTHFVRLQISDTGIGIPANVVDKIFDPFFSTKQEGSGLGLSICHSIITKHNGHIDVRSVPGEGTIFNIYLPASSQDTEKSVGEQRVAENGHKLKILVMDDEEIVRDIAESMLTSMGHEVMLAKEGQEAVELYRRESENGEPVDLVIMDLTIPGGMGGKDAVKEISAIDPAAKVIVSSGYSNDIVMADCKEHGFCAAVVKPYRLDDLAKAVSQAVG